MSEEVRAHKDTAVLFSQSWNFDNYEKLETLLHPDFIYHSGLMGDMNATEYIAFLKSVRNAFPDGKYFIDDMVGDGDNLGIRHSFEGTMEGPIYGFEPTGKRAIQTVNEFIKFKEGRYIESWAIQNGFYLFEQLGLKA